MTEPRFSASAWIAAALLVVGPGAVAQPPSHHDHQASTAAASASSEGQPREVVTDGERQTTMDLEAIEAELDLLVTKINDSAGATKIDAMAELLATLVRQHRAGCGAMMRPAGDASSEGCCPGMKRSERSVAGDSGASAKPETEPDP